MIVRIIPLHPGSTDIDHFKIAAAIWPRMFLLLFVFSLSFDARKRRRTLLQVRQ
jgi:hypothetical protein